MSYRTDDSLADSSKITAAPCAAQTESSSKIIFGYIFPLFSQRDKCLLPTSQ